MMFNKLDKLRGNNSINLANESQAYSTILKALGLLEPLNKKITLAPSSTMMQDAYAEAMRSPYGSVIRQIIEGNILLTIMRELVIVMQKEIQILEKELKELEEEYDSFDNNNEGNRSDKTYRSQEVIKSEIILKEESKSSLQNFSDEYSRLVPYYKNQLSIFNAHYISGVEKEIKEGKKEVIEKAEALGYRLNDDEKAIITSMAPIDELRTKLLASYQTVNDCSANLQIPAAPAPPPVNAQFEAPSGAYLAARRLPDLELRTLMALNMNWNRQVHTMMNAPADEGTTSHTPSTMPTPDKERSEISILRAEFQAHYDEEKKRPIEERPARFQPRESDSRVIFSAQDSVRLLKDFGKTFHSLDAHMQALHDLHQGKVDDLHKKMRTHIENWNQRLNKTAAPADSAEPPKTTPSPSMAQS